MAKKALVVTLIILLVCVVVFLAANPANIPTLLHWATYLVSCGASGFFAMMFDSLASFVAVGIIIFLVVLAILYLKS